MHEATKTQRCSTAKMRAMDQLDQWFTSGDKLTRRDCTLLGAKWAALCAAATSGVVCLPFMADMIIRQPSLWDDLLIVWFQIQFITVPPAAGVGALLGFELYRVTVGSTQLR